MTHLFERRLSDLGVDTHTKAALRKEGYLVLQRSPSQTALLTCSEDKGALFIVYPLLSIDPITDADLLPWALHLNLSPTHTLATSIGLDVEQKQLCLRYTHDLSVTTQYPLEETLKDLDALSDQITQILLQQQQQRKDAIAQDSRTAKPPLLTERKRLLS